MKKYIVKKNNKWKIKRVMEVTDYISFALVIIPVCYIIFQIVRCKI